MPRKSLLAAMAGVPVGCVVALLLGSLLHRAYPGLPDLVLGTLIAISWAVLAVGIFLVVNGPINARGKSNPPLSAQRREELKRQSEQMAASFREAKLLRIAELAADPKKSKYVPLMERDWWTDEQIAYHENPSATATCIHLQPVERAMRLAGIVPRLLTRSWEENFGPLPNVRADCCINEPELRRSFQLAESVRLITGYMPERSEFDNPWADLRCSGCGSAIVLVHPDYPRPTTVWFSAAPK